MPPQKISLIIEFTEDNGIGRVNVTGPLENDILCFGLLEKAKQTITDHNKKLEAQRTLTGGINPNSPWRPMSS